MVDDFLKSFSLMGPRACLNQVKKLKESKNDIFLVDGRGGKRFNTLYEDFPELEIEAKAYIAEKCSKKECNLDVKTLTDFINKKFFELTGEAQDEEGDLIRRESAVLEDLKRWGASFEPNSKRPYFEGHEREDVVEHRVNFIDHFLDDKDHYYSVDESKEPKWIYPIESPRVAIFHDESMFRAELCSKRWVYENIAPFFVKGQGKGLMVSDVLVMHPSGCFFELSETEMRECLKKYPDLNDHSELDYEKNTCTGSMNPGQDGYMDNECVLAYFERLFRMIEFKEAFHRPIKHKIEVIVDNARTHTKMDVNINEFRLNPGKYCPLNVLEWTDENNNPKSLDLFYDKNGDMDGNFANESKGLKQISRELNLNISHLKLADLKAELKKHPAFKGTSKLELLGKKYGIDVIFVPKYHCELNPTEGLWCNQKAFIRKRSDQTYKRLIELMPLSREHFKEINLNIHLMRRFWRVLNAYKKGFSYGEILRTYFSGKTKENIISHRKICNTQLNI